MQIFDQTSANMDLQQRKLLFYAYMTLKSKVNGAVEKANLENSYYWNQSQSKHSISTLIQNIHK